MQIVIDIPEEVKHKVYAYGLSLCPSDKEQLINAIMNGTPLPKGHGRLIDYSWVVANVIKKLGIKDERYLLEAEKALMSIIKIAPTIIEADKVESQEISERNLKMWEEIYAEEKRRESEG